MFQIPIREYTNVAVLGTAGPPPASSNITTEASDPLITESSDNLVTET